jgi:diacylglycerol diphosphate phosphatase / phosphatidate phosphatase
MNRDDNDVRVEFNDSAVSLDSAGGGGEITPVAWWTPSYFLDWAVLVGLAVVLAIVWAVVHPVGRFLVPNDPSLQYPYESQTVPTWLLFILAVVVPVIVMFTLLGVQRLRKQMDNFKLLHNMHHVLLGFIFTIVLTLLVTEILKDSIGRYRPNFFAARALDPNNTKEFQLSWPSGHSSLSFACLTFLSSFLASKLGLGSNRSAGRLWLVLLCWSPYALAFFIAASRIFDYWHHPSDVLAGVVIGLLIGNLSVMQFFDATSGEPFNRLSQEEEKIA